MRRRGWLLPFLCASLCAVAAPPPPGEVSGLLFTGAESLAWDSTQHADFYNVYRGAVSDLADGQGAACHGTALPSTVFLSAAVPEGEGYFFLVTAESPEGEGPAGVASSGAPRDTAGFCTPVLQSHVQDRLGFGADEWSAGRMQALGFQDYIDEQLDPAAIGESTNLELQSRLAAIEPPDTILDLLALQVVKAVYSRRQLEQQVAAFWANHFNTDWSKVADLYVGAFPDCVSGLPQCDPNFPERGYLEASMAQYREMEAFRALAFGGTFREILEASAKSAAMIIYLDTLGNVAPIANENYARELLELYAMGVDGGYTQTDVEETARVFTGWTLCKKELAQVDDPLAPCHPYWEELPVGRIVATFVPEWHDCGAKVLFAGEPEEVPIPSTCGAPADGVHDLALALDAIASHPSTKRFISGKILQQFVVEQPGPAMVDALVDAWDNPANHSGAGDLREILRAALTLDEFLDPDRVRTKIKTPLEHFASAFRAIRGTTDGADYVINYLASAQHLPHYNPVPTGFPEAGGAWIDTTNTLTRQNFGLHLAVWPPGTFGSDPIALLEDNGVSTTPGSDAAAIIDFLDRHLFAGTLSPADRQGALGFLTTDDLGNPSPFDEDRLRKTVGMMLGFAQFQEQ